MIETLTVVRSVKLCVFTVGTRLIKTDYHPNIRCSPEFSYGDCDTQQVGSILMSNKYPTLVDYLREFGQRIHRDHVPTSVDVT